MKILGIEKSKLEPAPQGMGAPQATESTQQDDVEGLRSLPGRSRSPLVIHIMPANVTRACVRLLQITVRPELPKSNCKSELDKCEAMEATQTHRVKKCTWGWTQHRANIETKYKIRLHIEGAALAQ